VALQDRGAADTEEHDPSIVRQGQPGVAGGGGRVVQGSGGTIPEQLHCVLGGEVGGVLDGLAQHRPSFVELAEVDERIAEIAEGGQLVRL
jgi:hypothetical protein